MARECAGAAALAVALVLARVTPAAGVAADPECDPGRFEKEVLVAAAADPMALEVLPDGRVLFIERHGAIKLHDPRTGAVAVAATLPVAVHDELGLLSVVKDDHFAENGFLYFSYAPAGQRKVMRLSRFVLRGQTLERGSEAVILEYPFDKGQHMGGGLAMDGAGNLYFGSGDDSTHRPDPPLDQRPGKELVNALRTSANTRDLRGKIIRIRPGKDGGYTIPSGNLFPDGKDGRPEIYAMGVRNGFRLSVDRRTGWLYFGEVGGNTDEEWVRQGKLPPGYDEINQVRRAGNFGWPMFAGPNEPFAPIDFAAGAVGAPFSPEAPENPWPRNPGARALPPAQPALIWYPTGESERFPELGRGGRTAMAGPVFHRAEVAAPSPLALPACLDGRLFIYEWSRNWIKTVKLDAAGDLAGIEAFAPGASLRKPIDLKIGPDGVLYVVEFGETWGGNNDGQITRIVYRRGNRPPVARATATPPAGKDPLVVRLHGSASSDPDGDRLRFAWRIDDSPAGTGARLVRRFARPGHHRIALTVTDAAGATHTAVTEVHVGNAAPRVEILAPPNGSFVDPGARVRYRVSASDAEDGSTDDGRIAPHAVVVWGRYQASSGRVGGTGPGGDEAGVDPGLALMRRSSCFSCHTPTVASGGPPYVDVARRYEGDPDAPERLARRVLSGGIGVWGDRVMPPHPQHTLAEARLMVGWVLSLAREGTDVPVPGLAGELTVPRATGTRAGGVYLVHARYVDGGARGQPPLAAETVHVLHARRRRAAFADFARGAQPVDDYGGDGGLVTHVAAGGFFGFQTVNLDGIAQITVRAASMIPAPVTLELRAATPTGTRLGAVTVPARRGPGKLRYHELALPLAASAGPRDLYVVARAGAGMGDVVSVNWLEFHARDPVTPDAEAGPRAWDTAGLLARLAEIATPPSRARGRAIFASLACASCHRMNGAGAGLGPDLGDIARRRRAGTLTRAELVRDLVEPAAVVAEAFRPTTIETHAGETLTGLVIARTPRALRIAPGPAAAPDDVRELPLSEVKAVSEGEGSPMPEGLLATLGPEEILDLVAYLEGDADDPARPPRRGRTPRAPRR